MSGMMRGHLKLMILNVLDNNALSGSEIMNKLEQDIGWKPSCGSVYPILNSLVDEQFTSVKEDKSSTRKVYSLTKKGTNELKKHNNNKEELMNEIVKVHKMIESTYGVDLQIDDKMINNLKSGKLLFGKLHKESEDMKKEFMAVLSDGLVDTKTKEIREILKDTTKRLRDLRLNVELEKNLNIKRGKK